MTNSFRFIRILIIQFPDNSKSCGNHSLIFLVLKCLIWNSLNSKEFYLALLFRIKREVPEPFKTLYFFGMAGFLPRKMLGSKARKMVDPLFCRQSWQTQKGFLYLLFCLWIFYALHATELFVWGETQHNFRVLQKGKGWLNEKTKKTTHLSIFCLCLQFASSQVKTTKQQKCHFFVNSAFLRDGNNITLQLYYCCQSSEDTLLQTAVRKRTSRAWHLCSKFQQRSVNLSGWANMVGTACRVLQRTQQFAFTLPLTRSTQPNPVPTLPTEKFRIAWKEEFPLGSVWQATWIWWRSQLCCPGCGQGSPGAMRGTRQWWPHGKCMVTAPLLMSRDVVIWGCLCPSFNEVSKPQKANKKKFGGQSFSNEVCCSVRITTVFKYFGDVALWNIQTLSLEQTSVNLFVSVDVVGWLLRVWYLWVWTGGNIDTNINARIWQRCAQKVRTS